MNSKCFIKPTGTMKTLNRMTFLLALLSLISLQGYPQNQQAKAQPVNNSYPKTGQTAVRGTFTDADHDGVCDNYQSGANAGRGANFTDKNGDGVCDNFKAGGQGRGNPNCCRMGYQHRHGQGKGNCCGTGYQHRYRNGHRDQTPPSSDPSNTQ